MAPEHERIEELLAGYVLLSLSGEDAAEADRLLTEHVPACPICRDALRGFQAVAGDLPLFADPAQVPDLLLRRIRRGVADVPVPRRRGVSLVAVVASVAALVGMAGLSVSLSGRASRAEEQRGRALEVLAAMQQPGAGPVALESQTGAGPGGLVEVSSPSLEHLYLFGRDVPEPAPGSAYVLWLGSGGAFEPMLTFTPDNGLVLVELTVDTGRYDEIWITEEPLGAVPSTPSRDSAHSWSSSL